MARQRNTGGRVTPKGTRSEEVSSPRRRSWPAIVIVVLILAGLVLGTVASLFGGTTTM